VTFGSGKRHLGSTVNEQPSQATTNQAIHFHEIQSSHYAYQQKIVYDDASGAPHRSQVDYNLVPSSYMPKFTEQKYHFRETV
jgi:hypothetical protein